MEGDAATVDAYVAGLPDERREAISAVREAVNANLAEGFEEMMLYGMPSWVVALERYPDTYTRVAGGDRGRDRTDLGRAPHRRLRAQPRLRPLRPGS